MENELINFKENESSGQLFPFTEKLKFIAPDGKMHKIEDFLIQQ